MPRTLGNTYGEREGCVEVVHTYPFQFDTPGVLDGIHIDTISASTDRPVMLEISVQVITAFNNGTSAVLSVGTIAGADDLLSQDVSATGYFPASNAVNKFRIATPTGLYIAYIAGDTDTTGSAVVIIKEITQNSFPVA